MSLTITLGTDSAVEAGTGREIFGNQTTTINFDDADRSMAEVLTTVEATVAQHMTAPPLWIEASDPLVQAALCGMFDIPKTKKRPANWNKTKETS